MISEASLMRGLRDLFFHRRKVSVQARLEIERSFGAVKGTRFAICTDEVPDQTFRPPIGELSMAMNQATLFAATAQDLMSRQVHSIHENMPLQAAAHLLSQAQITGAPVVDDVGRCVG